MSISADHWVPCPASARVPRKTIAAPRPRPVELLLYGDATSVDELVDRHGVDEDIAALIPPYIEFVRSLNPQPGDRCDVATVGSWVYACEFYSGWRYRSPTKAWRLIVPCIPLIGPHVTHICNLIYQPRIDPRSPWREQTYTIEQFRQLVDTVYNAEKTILAGGQLPTNPGRYCRTCPHVTYCRTAIAATRAMYEVYSDDFGIGEQLDPEHLAAELNFLNEAHELLKARRDALMAEGEARQRQHKDIPGWYIKPTSKAAHWIASPEIVALTTGINPRKEVIRSPAELKRMGASESTVDRLSMRSPAKGIFCKKEI